MRHPMKINILSVFIALLCCISASSGFAGVPGQIGVYKVELTTEPSVIPVGKTRLTIKVTDTSSKPVEGALVRALVKMTSMSMGEKESTAIPKPGQPGVYTTEASFGMAGSFNAAITIEGKEGKANGIITLATGQDTSSKSGGGLSPSVLITYLFIVAFIVFIFYRMRVTGQHPNWRAVAHRSTLTGLFLIALIFAVVLYAVNHWRRPGAMTPVEAQAMQMSTPAPPGSLPITLAAVTRGLVASGIHYTGQAVSFQDVNITPRVQGWIQWMPYYVGNRVKAGQTLAKLDTSQQNPAIAVQQAGVNMAQQGVGVAQKEYQKALAEVHFAHGEEGMRRAAISEAQANVAAAKEERIGADAVLSSAQSKVTDTQAQVQAAQADQQYWQQEIMREKVLLSKGAVSKDEYQRELSQAATADAKVSQAQAVVKQAQADVRAAQAAINKANAMISAAGHRVEGATSDLSTHTAHMNSAQAAADAARQKIAQARSGVDQARAMLSGATTSRDYSEIRSLIDGVITQRTISPGQLVNPGQTILKVAQINPIRLQANVAQEDLQNVHIGARVMVRSQNGHGSAVIAHVTSITPVVDPVSRTGILEALVPNKDSSFLPGQYVIMDISTGANRSVLRVPSDAVRTRTEASGGVQANGAISYVWVAEPIEGEENQFSVQAVTIETGMSDGMNTEIVSGLKEGQRVVLNGADYLKSGDTVSATNDVSSTKIGTADSKKETGMANMPGMTVSPAKPASPIGGASVATVEVSSKGFTPDSVTLKAGVPARLTFIRKDAQNCGTEITMPEYGIRKPLPLNQPVVLEFTPHKGEIKFVCGMGMLKGKVLGQ